MIPLLNQQLADTVDLYSQAKQAHWNVKGPQFIALHELFDKLAAELDGYADMIAERATALGGLALGTVRQSAANSQLPECDLDVTDSLPTVQAALRCLLSPRLRSIRYLHNRWDSYPAETTFTGTGLAPAGNTNLSRRTWTRTAMD